MVQTQRPAEHKMYDQFPDSIHSNEIYSHCLL
jgi:hypothetical protein